MIKGISHITLSVRSLEESFLFYTEVLGFKPLMKSPQSAYLLAGDLWFCIEEDGNTRTDPRSEYTHIAFSVAEKDFDKVVMKITESGAQIFKENSSEGNSIYFLDPNGHKLEVHVGDWKSRLYEYQGRENMEFFTVD